MEEIEYCIEIVNLFENDDYTNSYILKEIADRNYKETVVFLDKIKLEDNTVISEDTYGSGYIGFFDIEWYQKRLKKDIAVLEENISKASEYYRHGYSFLDYIHRLQQLFINKKLDEKEMLGVIHKMDNAIGRKHLFISLLEFMQKHKKWDDMEYYINQMPVYRAYSVDEQDRPTAPYGYQIRIYEFIDRVNLVKFKEYFKKCMPNIYKYEMKEIKSDFIKQFSIQKGVKDAMALTQKAPFKNFEIDALSPQINFLSYLDMFTLINEYEDVLKNQKAAIKERLLVDSLKVQFDKGNYNEHDFLEVYEMINAMDRKEVWGDVRLKDALFFDLGTSTNNLELIVNCRKKIKHNLLKSELKYWENKKKKLGE
jgi:hypothetical protein